MVWWTIKLNSVGGRWVVVKCRSAHAHNVRASGYVCDNRTCQTWVDGCIASPRWSGDWKATWRELAAIVQAARVPDQKKTKEHRCIPGITVMFSIRRAQKNPSNKNCMFPGKKMIQNLAVIQGLRRGFCIFFPHQVFGYPENEFQLLAAEGRAFGPIGIQITSM